MIVNKAYQETNNDECVADVHTLILYNDDFNSFDFVIDNLVKICKHEVEQATQCALLVHYTGKTDIKHGDLPELYACKNALTEKGLSVEIQVCN